MYLNKAMVFGNLTRDPELRALPNGTQVCALGLATNRVWNDKDGQRQEQTEYHNVTVFGRQAENCAKYLSKGNGAYVEGRLQTRSWEKDGVKQYRTEIIADTVQFGPKGGGTGGGGAAAAGGSTVATGAASPAEKAPAMPEYPTEEINPEDIPF
ncbi:MAG: single-stranded DNA-binding protein [Okeania sp. SIO3H1]|nr:single-stranded DNA-binding protein [Okeania sp. SIO3H1]